MIIKLYSYCRFYFVFTAANFMMVSFLTELYAKVSLAIVCLSLWCNTLIVILCQDRYDPTASFPGDLTS